MNYYDVKCQTCLWVGDTKELTPSAPKPTNWWRMLWWRMTADSERCPRCRGTEIAVHMGK